MKPDLNVALVTDAKDISINLSLAEYVPDLRCGKRQTEFYLEFHDRALLEARCLTRRRDPNKVANLSEDDLETAVDDAFRWIFAAAEARNLERLTWAYVKTAISHALTPMLRRGWLEAKHRCPMPTDPEDPVLGYSDDLDVKDLKDLFDKASAKAQLNEHEKKAVHLRFFHSKTWDETAEALGVTVGQARNHLRKALEKLLRWFGDEFGPEWRPADD